MNGLARTLMALRGVVDLLLVLAVATVCYWAGDRNRDNAWRVRLQDQERLANKRLVREVERGMAATTDLHQALDAQGQAYRSLEEKFHGLKRSGVSVLAGPVSAGDGLPDNGVCTCGHAAVQGQGLALSAVPGVAEPNAVPDDPDDPVLSNGAVWMWNSALAGRDVPSGACGAADTSAGACAPGSGVRLEAAWDNQAANAKSCAVDRLRYQRLINFLESKSK